MKSLLPPNATRLERNIEKVTARISDVPVPIRNVWNPDTCPEHLLPWLAWSLGVVTWKSYWPESVRRNILKNSIETKRRQGTAFSVRRTIESFGAAVALREAHTMTPPGPPHSFDIVISATDMGDEQITADYQQDIIDEVTRIKPARSYFTVAASLTATTSIGLVAAGRLAIYRRLKLSEPTISASINIGMIAAARLSVYRRLGVSDA